VGGQEMEIKFTPDYKANELVFWHIFKELSNNNNGFVAYDKLQERLISTGKLDAGKSVLMIDKGCRGNNKKNSVNQSSLT
jgi:hypothetical protein